MKSGLYARAGASATATAAACANLFEAPMTNVSKLYFSFSRVCEGDGLAGRVYGRFPLGVAPAAVFAVLKVGQISVTAASASPASSTSSESADSVAVSAFVATTATGASVITGPGVSPLGMPGTGWTACTGMGVVGGLTGSGESTFTARETVRPSLRDNAAVIGSRSARSIASFAKSLGAASRAVPSRRPIGRVTLIHARC